MCVCVVLEAGGGGGGGQEEEWRCFGGVEEWAGSGVAVGRRVEKGRCWMHGECTRTHAVMGLNPTPPFLQSPNSLQCTHAEGVSPVSL